MGSIFPLFFGLLHLEMVTSTDNEFHTQCHLCYEDIRVDIITDPGEFESFKNRPIKAG